MANTYYFNASDAGPTDSSGEWTDDANAFDGDTETFAHVTTTGVFLNGTGTNAPTTGENITGVKARLLAQQSGYSSFWTDWDVLSTPTGGWTWQKVNDLECSLRLYAIASTWVIADIYSGEENIGQASKGSLNNGFQFNFYKVEIEVSTLVGPFPMFLPS